MGRQSLLTMEGAPQVDGPIVVGTDGLETVTKAVIEAIRLARALGLPLHIVTAYRARTNGAQAVPGEFDGGIGSLVQAESLLAEAASRARTAGVTASTHPVEGDPAVCDGRPGRGGRRRTSSSWGIGDSIR